MKRPLVVTIVAWFFILAGTAGFFYHLPEVNLMNPFSNDAILILIIRLLAVVGGVLILRGSKIGLWLIILWMTYHVLISFYHSTTQVAAHAVFLVILVWIFFHPKVAGFFREEQH